MCHCCHGNTIAMAPFPPASCSLPAAVSLLARSWGHGGRPASQVGGGGGRGGWGRAGVTGVCLLKV